MNASQNDISLLNALYENRRAFQGELHDHAKTGGTSDGQQTLDEWKAAMEKLDMDFATILDHKQVRHMYLPEWEDGMFIGGTEPGTNIVDSKAKVKGLHYNMVFAKPEQLEELLTEFEEYEFTGGMEGHFIYPDFTRARFSELISAVKAKGGFFVCPHPTQIMKSDDPCDYWFQDETGMEIFYIDMVNPETVANYDVWTGLLACGKRVWACAGGDGHGCASDAALTTIYAEERSAEAYLKHLRAGDFTCGPVGIRMCIGETKMGGQCSFEGKRLVLSVGDFHKSIAFADHTYRVEVINDKGVVFSQEVSCDEVFSFAMDTEKCAFYRIEIFDATRNLRIAIGNPIWNTQS